MTNKSVHEVGDKPEPTSQAQSVSSLPWSFAATEARWGIYNDTGRRIAIMSINLPQQEENARFIITACNSHTALVERVAKLEGALLGLLPLLDWDVPEDSDDGKVIAAARALLAKP